MGGRGDGQGYSVQTARNCGALRAGAALERYVHQPQPLWTRRGLPGRGQSGVGRLSARRQSGLVAVTDFAVGAVSIEKVNVSGGGGSIEMLRPYETLKVCARSA